jgi:hypothetical protein
MQDTQSKSSPTAFVPCCNESQQIDYAQRHSTGVCCAMGSPIVDLQVK